MYIRSILLIESRLKMVFISQWKTLINCYQIISTNQLVPPGNYIHEHVPISAHFCNVLGVPHVPIKSGTIPTYHEHKRSFPLPCVADFSGVVDSSVIIHFTLDPASNWTGEQLQAQVI